MADGWLPGLPQTIVRAETMALISALRWSLHWGVHVHVWLGALEVHKAFQRRLDGSLRWGQLQTATCGLS